MKERTVAYKLQRHGAVLVLAEHYLKFCEYLDERGIEYEDDYVESMDAYLFTKKKREGVVA